MEKLTDYDSAEHFTTDEERTELLQDALDQGDGAYIAHALGIIARAQGMTDVALKTGIKRQQLYVSLSENANPTIGTISKVLAALNLRLKVEAA